METTYCFHLGRNRDLSLAELRSFFGKEIISHGEIALLETTIQDPQKTLNQLGGILKISQKIDSPISQIILSQKPEGKIKFGLNIMPQNKNFLRKELKRIKNELKAAGRNARFINKDGNLSSAMIVKGGLMKDLTDFNLIKLQNQEIITQTIAVQDFVTYSLRDYQKPVRLAKEGMLPPKLAQIMINLTGLQTGTLYDPFCGSGTVLGEGLLKGMNVIGSDLDPKAIEAATRNTTWIKNKFSAPGQITLFEKDAQEIAKPDLSTQPDLIVAETHLGPPCNPKMTTGQIKNIQDELLPLYKNTFQNLHPLLKPNTPLVIAFPLHHVNRQPQPLPGLTQMLEDFGYQIKNELIYHREKQIVGRQIIVLNTTTL
ncbi:hypothetical protein HN748_06075 [Candidatus Peregrinibacteria bacterium]|jgi:tRNA G10  N-methylase Trm11|nr:hypothetical protein [Candidatus Peregrinibacteria bacterium]MBT7484205.1 hypothetical protein [Candidatus Peregrinibacteria bacterium]MBT7703772.1 hypothetical protein [Candidatus Peregrinibacteria bacterium]